MQGETQRGDLRFQTIPHMLKVQAQHLGSDVALFQDSVALTYQQLRERVLPAAKGLLALNVAHGDRVAIWAPNIWEWVIAALAIHHVGGVVVPINTRYKAQEAAFILRKSQARVLFTMSDFLNTNYVAALESHRAALPQLEKIIVLRGPALTNCESFESLSTLGSSVSDEALTKRSEAVKPDDIADILFTSGTTGEPKGAMCTHAQNLRVFAEWSYVVGLERGDRYLIVMPFFHSFGYKAGWLAALMSGATIFPEPVFDVDTVLKRVQAERITMLPGPPALYQSILMHPQRAQYDISSLRLAVTGASVIPVELIERMRSELGFQNVITGYGLTESCGVATMCRFDDDPKTIATTSGRAISDVEVRTIDELGKPTAPNMPGEIVVRGYNIMKGYFNAEAETRATIDAEGWLHTGDIGTLDERGYLKIVDRLKDMVIVGGFNVYPAEIENTLLQMPGVKEAAVIGVPDQRMGEVCQAFVVAAHDKTLSEAEVLDWCKPRMANFKVPRRVLFVDALPRNASGKVTKNDLRKSAHERV